MDYIIKNRTSLTTDDYDFVIGKTLSNCHKQFKDFRNKHIELDVDSLLSSLNSDLYKNQICIKTEYGISQLKLKEIHCFSSEDFE